MTKRGEVKAPQTAPYLAISANADAFGALWKKRIVLGWYPGKTLADAYLGCFILENINWKSGEFQSILRDNKRHTTRSLANIAGLPKSLVSDTIQRWESLKFIGRYAPGPKRPGTLSINWNTLRDSPHLSGEWADLPGEGTDDLPGEGTVVSGERADLPGERAVVSVEGTDRAPLYKDNHSYHSSHLGEGARSAPPNASFAGANPSDKERCETKGVVTDSAPPIPPRGQVASATKPSVRNADTPSVDLPANFGSDPNNLNPYAKSVIRNRRYGGLAGLDGSEGVTFDLDAGTLDVVNGTRATLEREASERGLDLSAALVKAATKLAKDPRNASPMTAITEIRQALQYQEQDRRTTTTKKLSFGRGGFGRNFKGL